MKSGTAEKYTVLNKDDKFKWVLLEDVIIFSNLHFN